MIYILNLIQFLLGFLELLLCLILLKKISGVEDDSRLKQFLMFGIIFILALIETINRSIRLYSILLIIFVIIFITLTYVMIYKGKPFFTFVCTSVYCFGLALLDLFIIFTMGIVLKKSTLGVDIGRNIGSERLFALFLGRFLLYIIYLFVMRVKSLDINKYMKTMVLILFAQIVGVCYFQSVYAGGSLDDLAKGYFTYLTIAVLVIITFGIYTIYRGMLEESKIIKLRTSMLEQSYEDLKRNFYESRTLFHDYKAHIVLLRQYIADGDTDKAQSYIDYINKPIANLEKRIDTGNESIDLVINYKFTEVKGKGIKFRYDISPIDLSKLNIEEGDLFVILYNLLDNAIEACEKVSWSNRWIDLSIRNINEMFMICIQNSLQIQPRYENNIIITSKKDKQFHGIGISSVKKLVEKYGGCLEFKSEKMYFEVIITFF